MKSRRYLVAALLAGGPLFTPAVALAGSPTDKPVPSIFSDQSSNAFKFLASTSADQLFYVPRSGGVRLDGDLTNPIPNFSASTIYGTWMPFLNKPLTSIGGTLTTSNHLDDYVQMVDEARAAGYSVAPSPIAAANTKVMLIGIPDSGTGHVHTTCEEQTFTIQDTDEFGDPINNPDGTPKLITVKVPVCYIVDPLDPAQKRRTDVLLDYNAIDVSTSDVEGDYSFQGIVHPGNASLIKNKLKSGARWDDLLKVVVEWTITQEGTPRYAEVEVDWSSVFTQVWTKAALHNFACLDVQMEALIRDVTTCEGQPDCGVRVHWFDEDGHELPKGQIPPGAEFGDIVNGIVKRLEAELANTIVPELGDPGDVDDSSAIFTVKANFQKLSVERHETIPVYYFPKAKTYQAATTMTLGCLKGNVDDLILWHMANPECRKMLEESNLGQDNQDGG